MRNIKLTIEYDGTNYCGWQVQPNGITVQEVLKKTIMRVLQEKIVLIGAGRTDSGVHAHAQVA
ncbi:tRNA pseudouridine(38-40) synthase TruA, partial [bacterium]|nr:tRNA pseudouridine(38-40) synthase TruA [bacterium]